MRSLLFLSLFVVGQTAFAERELVDRIAAIVDAEPLMYSEVEKKVETGPLVIVSDYPADEDAPNYEKALQDAINFELVIQKARDLEIDIDMSDVDADIDGFLSRQGLSRDELMQHLRSQGQTYDQYRDDYRNIMILRRFQGQVIAPLVKITDKDVETFYLKRVGAASDIVELKLRQILIKVDPAASQDIVDAKEALAQEVHGKLTAGTDFVEMVKIYSDDAAARTSGGLMTGIHLRDLAGPIRAEVENLDVGQYTIPVRTQLGFHIFYLEDKAFSGSQDYQEKKKQLEFELRNLEIQNQTREWLAEQRQRTKVEIIPE